MSPLELSSRQNPLLKEYKKLAANRRYRRKVNKIAVEGPNLVGEALAAGLIPDLLFFADDFYAAEAENWLPKIPVTTKLVLLPAKLFNAIADTDSPRAVAAIFPFLFAGQEIVLPDDYKFVLFIDRVQDPGNLGTIIRTATAAGVGLICCTAGCTDPYSPKVLRSTAGAIFRAKLQEIHDPPEQLKRLKETGFQVVAADPRGEQIMWAAEYKKPLVLVIGNEAAGVAENLMALAELRVRIPLRAAMESLNAAVAAGVIIYEINRQFHAG